MEPLGQGGQGDIRKDAGPNWGRILLPIVGLIVIAGAAAMAVLFADDAAGLVRSRLGVGGNIPANTMQLAMGGIIFLVILLVFAIIFAIFAPKPQARDRVTESALDKEKKEKQADEQRRRRLQRQLKQKMRERNKGK